MKIDLDLGIWFDGVVVRCVVVCLSQQGPNILCHTLQAILRANHARGIWDLSWLSTLAGISFESQAVGVVVER